MREPFVGRDRELAELLSGLEDAVRGRGSVFLIAGEAGIGKSALAEQVADRAAERGAQVAWGRGWEGGSTAPYWIWAQVIRAVVEGLDDETLRTLFARPGAAHLAPLVPELAERYGRTGTSLPVLDRDADRFYLFEAAASFLKHAASVRPVLLVLDDLLAGDQPSLLLLRFLTRDVPTSHLMLLATYRDAEAARSSEALNVLADMNSRGRLLRLTGLGRDEVRKLIAEIARVEPWEGKVAAIHEATGGNPLYVREVTRLVAATDALERPGRLTIPIPDTVRAVIRRRLASLSADAVQVLSAAAVVGREFDVALVGAASGLSSERVLDSLSQAVGLQVVEDVSQTGSVYRFSHPLMREAIYEGLPLPARMQMHQRVGEAIERLHSEDPSPRLAELAYHFAQVAATGGGVKAEEYGRRAGDQAMASYAFEDAAAHYRRALEALRFAPADEALRCGLFLCLGTAQARAGDYHEAKGSFAQAAEMARRLQDAVQLARAALGFGEPQVEGGLVDQQLLALLKEALDLLPQDDSALRARLLARFSLELTFSDDPALRETLRDSLTREALEMARRLGDVGALATACRARWMAVWGPDGLKERAALCEEILHLSRDTGDRELELIARARRITCSLEGGDIQAVDADIAAHARVADELRMPYHEWTSASLRAGRALLDGSLTLAEELIERALSVLPERPNARMAHLNQTTVIRWERGRLGELREQWHGLVEQFPLAGFAWGWLSLADAELGRADEARRELTYLVEELADLPRDGIWLAALATASLAAARLDDGDAAACVYPLLLPHSGWTIVIPMPHPVMCFGSASLYLGMLATVSSRWEEASNHFEAAVRANSRLGASAFVAHTQYEYARMLIARGRAADRKPALALLDPVEATARSVGMDAVAKGVAQLRALDLGTAVSASRAGPSVAPEAPVRNVFRREGDYWTIVFEGKLVRLRDSKGLRHLARLLAEPRREFHVLDLEAAESQAVKMPPGSGGKGSRTQGLETRADLGDAGELLDARAKAEYRARLHELQTELDEAESFNDPERAAKIKEEMDVIAGELARAVGLGGRDRRAASHVERARLNVTRAIRAAMGNVGRANPSLGRHLSSTIRTGRYCSYVPDARNEITWES